MSKDLYVINHSGGKDSQAMYLLLAQNIPHVVHADEETWEKIFNRHN